MYERVGRRGQTGEILPSHLVSADLSLSIGIKGSRSLLLSIVAHVQIDAAFLCESVGTTTCDVAVLFVDVYCSLPFRGIGIWLVELREEEHVL